MSVDKEVVRIDLVQRKMGGGGIRRCHQLAPGLCIRPADPEISPSVQDRERQIQRVIRNVLVGLKRRPIGAQRRQPDLHQIGVIEKLSRRPIATVQLVFERPIVQVEHRRLAAR